MKKGDIVLVPFPFTDLKGRKTRPALVLIPSNEFACVCFITTSFYQSTPSDVLINPSESNGLKKISLIKVNKITTIDNSLIIGKLGSLSSKEINKVNKALMTKFQLK